MYRLEEFPAYKKEKAMNTKNYTYKKWLYGAVFCIFLAVFLLTGSFTFLKDAHNVNTNISFKGEAYLSFNTNYVQPDKPLTVYLNNASSKDAVYEWTVGGTPLSNTTNTYTPSSDDLEKFITVTVNYDKSKTVSATLYCSKLPVIYINTDDMVGDVYVPGTMAMQGSPEYTSETTDFYFGDVYLKLRGNSTKYREKSPYKIKLGTAFDLFNMGKSKHWVLLANDIDHTFIRNKLTYDFSKAIGASYAAESLNVVLIMNNQYKGVYQLCEQLRVDDERVDIFDWEELAKDAASMITAVKTETEGLKGDNAKIFKADLERALRMDFSWASSPYTYTFMGETYTISDYVDIPDTTGGFLLEMDFYNLTNFNGIKTNFEQPFYFNTPEYGYSNKDMKLNAYKCLQTFEYALHSRDHIFHNGGMKEKGSGYYYDYNNGWIGGITETIYNDAPNDGKHYSQLFDMNSLLVNFFVCEFSMNWDSMKNSVFVTKDITGPAMLSPVWDFDWAYGNDNMYRINTNYPTGWHTTNNYFTNEQYYQSVQWNRYLIRDPYFLKLAYDKYKEIRPTVIEDIIKDGGLLDQYYNELYEAGKANDAKWSYSYMAYGGKDFEGSMDALKEFITTRVSWMDKQFESFETFVASLGYYTPSEKISVNSITYNDDGTVTIEGKTTDMTCHELGFQINGTTLISSYSGTDGIGRVKIDAGILEDEAENIIEIHGIDSDGNYIENLSSYKIF